MISFENLAKAELKLFLEKVKCKQCIRTVHKIDCLDYVDLYCYFKSTYGEPNGMQSILRRNDSDNIYHWNYCFVAENVYFDFVYSYRHVELLIISESKIDIDISQFIENIKKVLIQKKDSIKKQRDSIELWDIFQNTYSRLKKTIDYFYNKYREEYPSEVEPNNKIYNSDEEMNMYYIKMKSYLNKMSLVMNYGLGIRMLCPVAGEAFINLILYVLAKPEIRSDKRLFESITRSNIDIRIKSLHLYCNGIISAFDQKDIRFKDFVRLMDKRNDFLHGNITPAFNTFDHVYFDGTIPIFNEPRDLNKEFTRQTMFQISKTEIEGSVNTINHFISYILENITDKFRKEIEMIIDSREIGWNKKKNKLGILFPPYIVEVYPGAINSE